MKPPRFYLDSSIWNFAVADDVSDYREATEEFFDHVRTFGWETMISEMVFQEVGEAPIKKRNRLVRLIQEYRPTEIPLDEETLFLAKAYLEAGVLTAQHEDDCIHVACATCGECDYLLSWNFRHLANTRRAARFLAVNILHGYNKEIKICSPLEVYEI